MTTGDLIGIAYNAKVPAAADLASSLVRHPRLAGRSWKTPAGELEAARDRIRASSVVMTVGGDGTILRTVRVVAPLGVPILGVNMGRVGFMTEVAAADALQILPRYLEGEARVEERMMLEAQLYAAGQTRPRDGLHALNDVAVLRSAVAKLVDVEAWVDGVALTTYRADGVLVSTATGSTGYALSAGGPIVVPEARLMMLTPVAAHMSFRAGLVLRGESVVELRIRGDQDAVLCGDGFTDARLAEGDRVVVRRSPHVARFLRMGPPSDFFSRLKERLRL